MVENGKVKVRLLADKRILGTVGKESTVAQELAPPDKLLHLGPRVATERRTVPLTRRRILNLGHRHPRSKPECTRSTDKIVNRLVDIPVPRHVNPKLGPKLGPRNRLY